jgi:DNA-binding PadR family transcriptional regulator
MAETTDPRERADQHEVAEYGLLGLLRDAPSHGYALAADFAPAGRLGTILHLKMSQMYAYLHKLERHGWLVAHEDGSESIRPRRVFTLTDTGRETFDRWLAQPVAATRDVRVEFLVKLAFALERDPALAARLVCSQREATAEWLERLESQLASERDGSRRMDARALTLRHRILQSRATLNWLDEALAATGTGETGNTEDTQPNTE